jgi:hypothetical protein
MSSARSVHDGRAAAWPRTLGDATARLPTFIRKLGFAESSLGDLVEARRLFEEALRVGEAALAPCDRVMTSLMQALAGSQRYDGRYADARALLSSRAPYD